MTAGKSPQSWFFPWVPVGLIAVLGAALIGLMFIAPGTAPAAGPAPDGAAGFLTTDKLVLTVNVPPLSNEKSTLRVELVNEDDKVVAEGSRTLTKSDSSTGQRFEFAPPKDTADKLTLRCRLDKEEFKVPLKKVLLVKAHETSLRSEE